MSQAKIKQGLMKTGELLLENGLITKQQLDHALLKKKECKKRIGETLVGLGFVSEVYIAKVLSIQLGIPLIDFSSVVVEPEAIRLVPEELCKKHSFIPISTDMKVIKTAFADPLDLVAIDDLRFATSQAVQPMVSTHQQIRKAITQHYNVDTTLQKLVEDMKFHVPSEMPLEVFYRENVEVDATELIKRTESAPIIRMVNGIIRNSIQSGASDIHIEPQKRSFKLRERVDGLLMDVTEFPKWVQGLMTSRIKIMAKMDIAEKRVPQDGKVTVRAQERDLDLRISSLPTQNGEKIVIRILNVQAAMNDLSKLMFSNGDLDRVKSMIERPQGIVFLAGPTGSGKTSTLYSMINHIKSDTTNVVSLEDPVEYELPWISQVSVNEKVGLTFAFTLRSILRQDPDVILVGEIRDDETAMIATQASITGHLVLTSIHTNSAAGTITRLKNMGIAPYLIASSLNGVIAQRLVRLICQSCKTSYQPSPEELIKIGLTDKDIKGMSFYRGIGCQKCNNKGYSGRVGVFEVMVIDQQIRELIASDAPTDVIAKAAKSSGMSLVMQDALRKANEGLTTIDEISRVLSFEY